MGRTLRVWIPKRRKPNWWIWSMMQFKSVMITMRVLLWQLPWPNPVVERSKRTGCFDWSLVIHSISQFKGSMFLNYTYPPTDLQPTAPGWCRWQTSWVLNVANVDDGEGSGVCDLFWWSQDWPRLTLIAHQLLELRTSYSSKGWEVK